MSIDNESSDHLFSADEAAQYLRSPKALIAHWSDQGLESVKDATGDIIGYTRTALIRFASDHSFTVDELILDKKTDA